MIQWRWMYSRSQAKTRWNHDPLVGAVIVASLTADGRLFHTDVAEMTRCGLHHKRVPPRADCYGLRQLLLSWNSSLEMYLYSIQGHMSCCTSHGRSHYKTILSVIGPTKDWTVDSCLWCPYCLAVIHSKYYYHVSSKLSWNCINAKSTPNDLSDLITARISVTRMSLQSASRTLLAVPTTRTALASQAFSVCIPVVWNNLREYVHSCDCFKTYNTRLNMFYLTAHFFTWPVHWSAYKVSDLMALYKCTLLTNECLYIYRFQNKSAIKIDIVNIVEKIKSFRLAS